MASSRTFLVANVALVSLIGGMIWFLSTKGQSEFINLPSSEPAKVAAKSQAIAPAFSTEGLSKDDVQAIEALQAQLEEEKKRAEETRAKLQAREQKPAAAQTPQTAPPVASSDTAGLEVEQQKQRIAQMIEAQLKGAEAENKRLTQALLKQNQEIDAVKKQNSELARKLIKLDDSAQTLLAKLVADGKSISSSDQSYLGAMQDLQNETVSPRRSVNITDNDLINRVEVADTGDSGSIAAELRTLVDELMENKNKGKPAVNASKPTSPDSGQPADLQNTVNELLTRSEEEKAQRQFQADAKYLDSLTPMEKERLNETRWVTVRRGDTLYDIAYRVYNDGWLYHKLFAANPQVLSNPDLIKPGQRLRVPL
jgi:nucleoid-associated protein YgaU